MVTVNTGAKDEKEPSNVAPEKKVIPPPAPTRDESLDSGVKPSKGVELELKNMEGTAENTKQAGGVYNKARGVSL